MALDIGSLQQGMPLTDPMIQQYYLDEAARYGIVFSSLAMNVFGECSLLSPWDSAKGEEARNILKRGVMAAATMGIAVLQIPGFGESLMKDREDLAITAKYLCYAAQLAQGYNITIGTENTLNAVENRVLLEMVGEPNCKVYLDNQNAVFFSGENPAEMIRDLGNLVCEIHIKDGTEKELACRPLGEGNAMVAECSQALQDVNYGGWLVLENDYPYSRGNVLVGNSVEIARRDVQYLRQLGL